MSEPPLARPLRRPALGGLGPTLFLWAACLLTPLATWAQTPWREVDRQPRPEQGWCERTSALPASGALVAVVQDAGHQLLLLDAVQGATHSHCHLPVALQGAPQPSPDGRWLYWAANDGWVLRFDLQAGNAVLRARTGLVLQSLALSHDGRWLMAGHAMPHTAVLLDANLLRVKHYPVQALSGDNSSAVAHVATASARNSFVLTFTSLPEVWEISYNPGAEPIFDGLVHDYRMGEAIASAGFLGVRRTPLPQARTFIQADASMRHVLLAAPPDIPSADDTEVLNLDIRRRISSLALPQRPLPNAGASLTMQGKPWIALVTGLEGSVVLLDASHWHTETRRLEHLRGVASVRTHAATPWLWISHAAQSGRDDTLLLVDPVSGRPVHTLRAPGSMWFPVHFSADGRYAVLSTQGTPGSVRLVDSRTLHTEWQLSLPAINGAYFIPVSAARQQNNGTRDN